MFTLKMSNIFITMVMLFQVFYAFLALFVELPISASLFASQFFCFIIPSIIYMVATRQKITTVLEIKAIDLKNILYIIALSLLIQPFVMLVSAATSFIAPNPVSGLLTDVTSETPPIATMFIMCIAPAICEEIALRGAAAQNLKYQGISGALLNGLYFGLVHLNFHQFPYAFVLGVLLYYTLRITGSIFAPMLAHFIINLSQTGLFYLTRSIEPVSAPLPAESASNAPLFIFIILITWVFTYVFKKFAARNGFINIKPAEAENIFDSSFVLLLATYAMLMFLGQ